MRAFVRLFLPCLLALALLACQPAEPRPDLKGTDISDANFGGDFSLTDHTGKPRALSGFKGNVVALFFGYTHCPDVCPTTMAEYASAMKLLGPDAGRIQVLFVSVDPERDTPSVLKSYVPFFDKRFIGLTGSPAQVSKVAEQFKVVATKRPAGAGNYFVDHSAGSYLLDAEGRLRAYEPNGTAAAALAHDLKALLR